MPVFKLCLKLFLKNWISVSIYVGIFLLISVIIAATTMNEQQSGFAQEKTRIALIDDEKTPLTEGFRRELARSADFVSIPDDTEKLQDALFFRQVTYILRIPEGFTEDIMHGGSMQIEKTAVPGSAENTYIDISVQQYWNLARLYAKHVPDLTEQQLAERLKHDLSGETQVSLQDREQAKTSNSFSMYYFNFFAYTITAVLIMGISTVMIVFNKRDLRRRLFASPMSSASYNAQLLLANLLFALVSLLVLVGFCFVLDSGSFGTQNMVYLFMNAAALTACMTSLSFLIGMLIDNMNALSAVCNIVTLGLSFISGVFVPQEFLNDTVLKIASFTPTYWYVEANADIAKLTRFSWTDLQPVFYNMAILLIFTLVFTALSLVAGKKKRMMY